MKNYWKNKNVLITGVTGFVGGNLVKKLFKEGANIFGVIRNENPFCFLSIEKYDSKINLLNGDLMDHIYLFNIITEQKIDVIYHFAFFSFRQMRSTICSKQVSHFDKCNFPLIFTVI